jgi:hypothetical protein
MNWLYFIFFSKGFGQNIFLQADMTAESWSDDLMDDESENYKLLTAIIKTKVI